MGCLRHIHDSGTEIAGPHIHLPDLREKQVSEAACMLYWLIEVIISFQRARVLLPTTVLRT